MKWIHISKARPKFGQQYLISKGDRILLGKLGSEKKTAAGTVYEFDSDTDNPTEADYIAAVSKPIDTVTTGTNGTIIVDLGRGLEHVDPVTLQPADPETLSNTVV